jgi:hypothetical protein
MLSIAKHACDSLWSKQKGRNLLVRLNNLGFLCYVMQIKKKEDVCLIRGGWIL